MPKYTIKDKTKITDEMRELLKSHRLRTQIPPNRLIAEHCPDRPPLLTREMIEKWMRGTTKHADQGLYEYVISKYEGLPRAKQRKIPFTGAMLQELNTWKKQTGCGILKLLNTHYKDDPERPKGLSTVAAANWLHNKYTHVNEEYYEYIVECYRDLVEEYDLVAFERLSTE